MRRVAKFDNSTILTENLRYIPNNSRKNKKLAEALLKEQRDFCAYTDEYISRTDSPDIEHFNPLLKDTIEDNYNNWFVVKHQWNKEKSVKWTRFQPVMHPTGNDFEERIIYVDGDYIAKSEDDNEAKNLIQLLQLDDITLADKRKTYIRRYKEHITLANQEPEAYFKTLISEAPCLLSYTRAIKEEFNIDIWEMLR